MTKYFRGLPVKEKRMTRKGYKTPLNSSPKWFRMATIEYSYIVAVNSNLYGLSSFLNDGRKGCEVGGNRLYNTVSFSLLKLRRLGL